ncbi:hypothetical protein LTR36_001339 [Oleoguttula mirabilis]|uniref:Glutaminase A n=1 Tax=Oleoguttula mirabilis TaxID=1507867 RepID=A0AAV9JP06_9PEZI|nr:hypothetical protein LTR36_001339 [Oleoguttula mirabilis]
MKPSTLLFATVAGLCHAQSTFTPLRPPALPLAVKSPYMSTWQQAGSDLGNGGYLAGEWPTFWQGQVTGWTGFIRVDNVTYTWLGASNQNGLYVNQTNYEYTSTKSVFTMNAGSLVDLTITFLSSVTPDDLMRSSLPYSYMNLDISSADGSDHNVQIYTDISAEWVSGDHTADAQWSYGTIDESTTPELWGPASSATWPASEPAKTYGTQTAYAAPTSVAHPFEPIHGQGQGYRPTHFLASNPPHPTSTPDIPTNPQTGGIAYHQVYRQQQLNFSETNQQANWGYWYYATENTADLTHQSGADVDVRGQFLGNGYLADTQDTDFRAINNDYPVFGFAVNLGSVGTSSSSTLFQLSLHQDYCVQFEGASGIETIPCLWKSYFDSDTAALEYFYNDYETGSSIASAFDAQISTDSLAAGGQNYLSLTSLAARQAFGALEFTNTPEMPYVFLKEISSDGNIQTVDVMFPFHPIAVYLNATILRYMLDPLFINQEAGNWPYQFSIHDLGSSFPNATGHNDGSGRQSLRIHDRYGILMNRTDEMQPLEECGDMIIMTLAYAQRTNDNAYLAQHYDILKQWNEYLIEEALIPANQISTDDFAGALANQTNLALKGIIGIEAMAQIANRTGHAEDGANYTKIAHDYIRLWQIYGINYNATYPHAELNYGNSSSYVLLYNLYSDAELGLELVPQTVYNMQSKFYPTVFNEYGVPLDTRHTYTKNDWEIFCAAIASTSTKDEFTSVIAKWLNQTPTNLAFTDLYETISGE